MCSKLWFAWVPLLRLTLRIALFLWSKNSDWDTNTLNVYARSLAGWPAVGNVYLVVSSVCVYCALVICFCIEWNSKVVTHLTSGTSSIVRSTFSRWAPYCWYNFDSIWLAYRRCPRWSSLYRRRSLRLALWSSKCLRLCVSTATCSRCCRRDISQTKTLVCLDWPYPDRTKRLSVWERHAIDCV